MKIWNTIVQFRELNAKLTAAGINTNPDITRGVETYDAISNAYDLPTVRILDLDPAEAVQRALDWSHRKGQGGLNAQLRLGITATHDQLLEEMVAVVTEDTPRILKELTPLFDTAAQGVYAASNAGIRPTTTAEQVMRLKDPKAISFYQELPKHTAALDSIARLRIHLSEDFGVVPTRDNAATPMTDYTACFTAPESGITRGLHSTVHRDRYDWLTLAQLTGNRLALNTPATTTKMLRANASIAA